MKPFPENKSCQKRLKDEVESYLTENHIPESQADGIRQTRKILDGEGAIIRIGLNSPLLKRRDELREDDLISLLALYDLLSAEQRGKAWLKCQNPSDMTEFNSHLGSTIQKLEEDTRGNREHFIAELNLG